MFLTERNTYFVRFPEEAFAFIHSKTFSDLEALGLISLVDSRNLADGHSGLFGLCFLLC